VAEHLRSRLLRKALVANSVALTAYYLPVPRFRAEFYCHLLVPEFVQDECLPYGLSVYPGLTTVLDVFTYAGAQVLILGLGSGAGPVWWQSGGFSISANYVRYW